MEDVTSANLSAASDLAPDPRWRLVQKIASSPAFQKSAKIRDLLLYVTERTMHGHGGELTEHQIGHVLFGKPSNYTPTEDSSVRVHVRQLRLKLHEYFDGPGRHEDWIVEIPKGSYLPVFREAEKMFPPVEVRPVAAERRTWALLPWATSGVLAVACLVLASRLYIVQNKVLDFESRYHAAPWPLSRVVDDRQPTTIVIADTGFRMLQYFNGRGGSLEDYLNPDFQRIFSPPNPSARESKLLSFLFGSVLTSYAELADVKAILGSTGSTPERVLIRSARDLKLRDLNNGNYIFLGSPVVNPWVSLYERRLNFQEIEEKAGEGDKYFLNKNPDPGELKTYRGLRWVGTTGVAYATLAILPNERKSGRILVLQGLQQEGTEAAGLFLADAEYRLKLRNALAVLTRAPEEVGFEVLIRTNAIAGAPNATEIVASRLIQ